ncbi:hypothetical protein GCM10010336_00900 [Streptomyces goshikiensis]|nr:hypothetical protein GCM10010336_00900 [Streptomyces goshikiensis]
MALGTYKRQERHVVARHMADMARMARGGTAPSNDEFSDQSRHVTVGEGLAMKFLRAHSAAVLGPRRASIRTHGLYDPDWCLASITEGPGCGQLDQLLRTEFARPGFNCMWHWTVIPKSNAAAVADRFAEIGYGGRVVFKLLPPAPK